MPLFATDRCEMQPERKYWGPFCPLPRSPGPYIHVIYPVAYGWSADGPLTVDKLNEMLEYQLDHPELLGMFQTWP
jgi:hypothetical protein